MPFFAELKDAELAAMADAVEEERYAPGEVVFAEGDPGDRLLVVADGRAELCEAGTYGPVPLVTLGPGDMVGEQALLPHGTGVRNATLTAASELTLLALSKDAFAALLARHPRLLSALELRAGELATDRFVARVGPFMGLDAAARRALAGRLVERPLLAGQELVRQGERSDSCYLVRSGALEVVLSDEEGLHVLARVEAGSVVGEMAMLTDAPRSASVVAVEASEVLELGRADLDAILTDSQPTLRELSRLTRSRQCPRRDPLVLVTERRTREGEMITTLKHTERLTYHRLSERGRFIWDHLDGTHDLKSLTRLVLKEYGEFAPGAITDVVAGLSQSGMIVTARLRSDLDRAGASQDRTDRLLRRARDVLEIEVSPRDVDARLTRAYDRFGWLCFTRVARLLLGAVAVGGLVAFVAGAGDAHEAFVNDHNRALLWLVPALFVSNLLHEAAHAFTVKRFGREVHRAGVGWYWFGPIAFVDTTDMWLDGPRKRIVVDCAGPFANAVLGGLAAIGSLAVGDQGLAVALWTVAVPNYLSIITNLNPLLEFDGYHVLCDALDRPNLRSEALTWFGSRLRGTADADPSGRHRVDLAFSIGSVLYIAVNAVLITVVYRLSMESALESVVPAWLASSFGWIVAGGVSLLALLAVSGEMRGLRRAR